MKTRVSLTVVFVVICVWIIGPTLTEGAEWRVLQESSYGDTFSYDAASVKKSGDNMVTVRAGAQDSRYLYEIDCKNKRARLLEGAGASSEQWFPITSGEEELLYKAVCVKAE